MKNILLIGLVMLSASAFGAQEDSSFDLGEGSKWYVGVGIGQSIPKIALDEAISGVTVDIPPELGGGVFAPSMSVNSEFSSPGQKVFIGYDIGERDRWALEWSLIDFGKYTATASASGKVSMPPVEYTISGEGEMSGKLHATTVSTIYSFRLGKRFSVFPRVGIGYFKSKSDATERITVSINTPTEDASETTLDRSSDAPRGWLPVLGVGFDVDLSDQIFIRTEFERYGHPTDEYVDAYIVHLGYNF